MVDLEAAVDVARRIFESVYTKPHEQLNVEEIELSEDNRHWIVTLGFDDPTSRLPRGGLVAITSGLSDRPLRRYKVVTIDAANGQIRSLKDRAL